MGTTIKTLTATSALEVMRLAQEWIRSAAAGSCWFRGIKDSSLTLLPGAYWRPSYDEFAAMLQFSQEGPAFADVGEVDDWRTYYLAQHNGVPTRLLDWTENLFTALFFATDGWDGSTVPAVWLLRPEEVNRLSLGWSGLISPERNDELKAWMPSAVRKGPMKIVSSDGGYVYDSAHPLALYPRKNNTRLVAQQGTFTVHGTDRYPIDEWLAAKAPTEHERLICRIEFARSLGPEAVLAELAEFGLRRSTIYPDLHNFVLQMKHEHGW